MVQTDGLATSDLRLLEERASMAYAGIYMKKAKVAAERRVKVFRNGRNQAVRIPREFEFPCNEAVMRREGKRLVIEPAPARSLLAVLARLKPLKENFPPVEDKPPGPVKI